MNLRLRHAFLAFIVGAGLFFSEAEGNREDVRSGKDENRGRGDHHRRIKGRRSKEARNLHNRDSSVENKRASKKLDMHLKAVEELISTEDPMILKDIYFPDAELDSSLSERYFAEELDETWYIAREVEANYDRRRRQRDLESSEESSSLELSPEFPFLACSSTRDHDWTKTGYDRISILLDRMNMTALSSSSSTFETLADELTDFGTSDLSTAGTNSRVYTISNGNIQSCFSFRAKASTAENIATLQSYDNGDYDNSEEDISNEDESYGLGDVIFQGETLTVIPFTPSMKFEAGTILEIQQILDLVPKTVNPLSSFSSRKNYVDDDDDNDVEAKQTNIHVSVKFSPGVGDGTAETADARANSILEHARVLTEGIEQDSSTGSTSSGGDRKRWMEEKSMLRGQQQHQKDDNAIFSIQSQFFQLSYEDIRSNTNRELKQDAMPGTSSGTAPSNDCSSILHAATYSVQFLGDSFDFHITPSPTWSSTLSLQCIFTAISAIAHQPEVLSISVIPPIETQNENANAIVQGVTATSSSSSSFDPKPWHASGITGKGEIVAVSDSGLDMDNCYFYDKDGNVPQDGSVDVTKRKVIQYFPVRNQVMFKIDDPSGHGTHVAGTLAGKRSPDGEVEEDGYGDGIAPGAKLAFMDIGSGGGGLSPPGDPFALFKPGKDAGASIHSCSWGAGGGFNQYSFYARRFDEYVHKNQGFLVVVAAGNYGENGVTWPGTAKNVITVGATFNDLGAKKYSSPDYSGKGNVAGGRTKPDVFAPGTSLQSADAGSYCGTRWSQGTSMATPVISGIAALVRQYLKKYHKIRKPAASLIKAIIINGAEALTRGTPYDIHQSFGLANLSKSLPINGAGRGFRAKIYNNKDIINGRSSGYAVTIDGTFGCTEGLSATLVWTDVPGASLMNNLDLEISATRGNNIFYPNGRNDTDTVNNVERIRIDNVEYGQRYTVKVTATNLVQYRTRYSLVITGCVAEQESTYQTLSNDFAFKRNIFTP